MTIKQCIDFIRSDYYMLIADHEASLFKIWLYSWLNDGMSYMFWFRLTKCDNLIIRGGARVRYRQLMSKFKIEMPRQAHIGYGFQIAHGGPMVMNCRTKVGDNCVLFQFTSIGSSTLKAAEIGNEVYIGPNVSIVNNVKIGDGVTIGAGSVVVKDIEAGVTVAGVPAREISRKGPQGALSERNGIEHGIVRLYLKDINIA